MRSCTVCDVSIDGALKQARTCSKRCQVLQIGLQGLRRALAHRTVGLSPEAQDRVMWILLGALRAALNGDLERIAAAATGKGAADA